jgi:IS1 transposase
LSHSRVLKTLREAAAQVVEPAVPRRVSALELDEFWSFVRNKKQQRWTLYGFDRERRQVVAFVNERRTDAACRKLLKETGRLPSPPLLQRRLASLCEVTAS